MALYFTIAFITAIILGTAFALACKHIDNFGKPDELEDWAITIIVIGLASVLWPVPLVAGIVCLCIWLCYKFVNKFILKRKGKKDAS